MVYFFFGGCVQSNHQQILPQEKAALYKLKSKFKYQDLQEFEIDSFSFDTRPGHYEEIDSSAFKLIFPKGHRKFIGQGYDRDYYYSWQNRDTNFIEFTILTQDESSYCSILRYYIFDRKGKFISQFDLAADCGDAGWTFEAVGRQTDKDRFIMESREANTKEGSIPEDEKEEGDSINYSMHIAPDGTIIKKETWKKHFKDK
ncbi:hypothetical protein [Paraflavitalea speifideaquila]|uniref:hypothetical protein n=1 Tax=Paraflavitalea speifideaquila TaxID=3076558 RepID=UPI0028E44A7B|nr:hypothetical protein [Paraflavitalea speifideiaquila]